MTLLAWPGLLLLSAAAALAALAVFQPGARKCDVGTLLIWRRVAAVLPARRRRRGPDLLLWLLLGAAIAGAIGAARPALRQPHARPKVVVYVESSGPHSAKDDPELKESCHVRWSS